jgi:hypothetical protein
MKEKRIAASPASRGSYSVGLLVAILAVLFWRSFLPDYVHFSNDGPLGQQSSAWSQMPGALTGMWQDLNYVGSSAGTYTLSISALLHFITSPVGFAKFYPGPWRCGCLGLGCVDILSGNSSCHPLAVPSSAPWRRCSIPRSSPAACWGVASQPIAIRNGFFCAGVDCRSTT